MKKFFQIYLHRLISYDRYFRLLVLKKWWARLLDALYKAGVISGAIYFVALFIEEDILSYGLPDILYAFIGITTLFSGGIVAYHLFVWLILYVVYGKGEIIEKTQGKTHSLARLPIVFWVGVYFIIAGIIWLILGP